MDTLILVNPAAGAGRAGRLWRRWAETARRALQADVVFTEAPGHGRELARRAVGDGYRRIVAVGGDGTLHEVINGVPPASIDVAVVPVGTGNDFARSAGVPRDPLRAILGLREGTTRRVDLGRIRDEYYLAVAGAGFDAAVAARVRAGHRLRGTSAYLWAVTGTLRRYRNARCRLVLDEGTTLDGPCALIAVGNAPAYGGGMRICPKARLDDGLLDVCVVGDLSRAELLMTLPRVFTGSHVRHPRIRCLQAARLRIEGPAGVAVHADGEPAGHLPVDLSVASAALHLWMPKVTGPT